MAFPAYEWRMVSQDGGHGNNKQLLIPDGVQVGDLLLTMAHFGHSQGIAISEQDGTWTNLLETGTTDMRERADYHIVDGTEGYTGTDDVACRYSGRDGMNGACVRIQGGLLAKAATGFTSSAAINLPNLDVSVEFEGAGDYLWFAFNCMTQGYGATNSPGLISGFTNLWGATRTGDACSRLMVMELNASSYDAPSTPSSAGGNDWGGGMIVAVKAGGGGKKRGCALFILPGL